MSFPLSRIKLPREVLNLGEKTLLIGRKWMKSDRTMEIWMDTKQELHLLGEVNLDDLLKVATDQQVSAPAIGFSSFVK